MPAGLIESIDLTKEQYEQINGKKELALELIYKTWPKEKYEPTALHLFINEDGITKVFSKYCLMFIRKPESLDEWKKASSDKQHYIPAHIAEKFNVYVLKGESKDNK